MKKKIIFISLFSIPGIFQVQTARAKVIHNSEDAAAEFVDGYLDTILLFTNFELRSASAFTYAPAGSPIGLPVAATNSAGVQDTIYTTTVTLTENETYIIVANANVSATVYIPYRPFGLGVNALGGDTAPDIANTDLLLHHGYTGAPTVDAVETWVKNSRATAMDGISYTEFQGYLELPTDDYIIEVRDEIGAVEVASYHTPIATLSLDGAEIVVMANGFLDPRQNSNSESFGLFVALPVGGELIPLSPALLGIENVELNSFAIYPNPVNNQLNFELSSLNTDELKVRIVGMQGRPISNIILNSVNTTVDVSALSTGLYQATIADDNNIGYQEVN